MLNWIEIDFGVLEAVDPRGVLWTAVQYPESYKWSLWRALPGAMGGGGWGSIHRCDSTFAAVVDVAEGREALHTVVIRGFRPGYFRAVD